MNLLKVKIEFLVNSVFCSVAQRADKRRKHIKVQRGSAQWPRMPCRRKRGAFTLFSFLFYLALLDSFPYLKQKKCGHAEMYAVEQHLHDISAKQGPCSCEHVAQHFQVLCPKQALEE